MVKHGLIVNMKRCIGCNECFRAMKDEHVGNDYMPWSKGQPETTYTYYEEFPPGEDADVPNYTYTPGHKWLDVLEIERGKYPWLDFKFMPLPCQMCENPPCMEAFPDQIYMRDDGIVIIDPDVPAPPEIVDSCPYGVIYYNEELGIGQKDTWDVHLIEEGKNPKFVDVCPVGVFRFGDLDDPSSDVSELVASGEARQFRPELGTEPKAFYMGLPLPSIAGHLLDNRTKTEVLDANVTVTNLRTGETTMTSSDHAGNFLLEDLQEKGVYLVRVDAPGYYTRVRVAYLGGDGFTHFGRIKLFPR